MEIKKVVFKSETETAIFCEVHMSVEKKIKKWWFKTETVTVDVIDLFSYDMFWIKSTSSGIACNCRTNKEVHGVLGNLIKLAYKYKCAVTTWKH